MNELIIFNAWDTWSKTMRTDITPDKWCNKVPSNVNKCWELLPFTGIRDKDNERIHKGDIIQDTLTQQIYEVKIGFAIRWGFTGVYGETFDGQQKPISNDYSKENNEWIKKIGNIFETPALLQ